MKSSPKIPRQPASFELIKKGMKRVAMKRIGSNDETNFGGIKQIISNAMESLEDFSEGTLEKTAQQITQDAAKYPNIKYPEILARKLRHVSPALSQYSTFAFLKEAVPLRQENREDLISELRRSDAFVAVHEKLSPRKTPQHIGKTIAGLFKYSKNGEDDNIEILCEAIPKLFASVFKKFGNLKRLPADQKKIIYNSFLEGVLEKKLWCVHEVENSEGEVVYLDGEILKDEVDKVAHINFRNGGVVMLPASLIKAADGKFTEVDQTDLLNSRSEQEIFADLRQSSQEKHAIQKITTHQKSAENSLPPIDVQPKSLITKSTSSNLEGNANTRCARKDRLSPIVEVDNKKNDQQR